MQVCQALLGQHDHPAGTAFEKGLEACKGYQDCLRAMLALKLVSAIRTYRNYSAKKRDYNAIDAEMLAHGLPLPATQILYRGCIWNDGKAPIAGDIKKMPQVMSTSWTPQVALWHARKAKGGSLLILTVTPGPNPTLKAFAFKNRRSEALGHELEVLVEAGAVLTCTEVHETAPIQIIECTLGR